MTQTTTHKGLILTQRMASLEELAAALDVQGSYRQDIVAPLTAIRSQAGVLNIEGMGVDLSADGVTRRAAPYRPLATFDGGLAERLPGLTGSTLGWARQSRPDIYDEIVNRSIHGGVIPGGDGASYPPLDTNVLMRLFSPDGGKPGYARAMLSDSYKPMDNVDLFYLVLAAIREAQQNGNLPGDPVIRSNLTEDTMDLRIRFPGISVVSDELVRNYQAPFRNGATRTHWWRPEEDGGERGERGRVDLALRISNGELGNKALRIAPEAWLWECGNGQIAVSEMVKAIHIGGKLAPGEIKWGADTQAKAMELATLKLRDALNRFLEPGYLENTLIAKLMEKGDAPITDPADAIKYVTQTCGFPKDMQEDLLRHFSLGARMDAFGVASAVTSYAQELDDPALALELEWKGEKALDAAAAYSAAHPAATPAAPAA
jgi:hypothetical protein